MIKEAFKESVRSVFTKEIAVELLVVGGGMAGVCAAITAARQGIKVALVQDRPVLGGNASSEVRLWILGATSHMGNNNRWAREGGVIDEILLENLYRNKEGNTLILDTILLEKVANEPNITLLLNTAVYEVVKSDPQTIQAVHAFCSQNSTQYKINATLFCDASGDGLVAFQAGAPFRIGAEPQHEFGEKLAPEKEYGELLGHTIYFYSKRAEQPVKFVAPEFALKDIKAIPRYKKLNEKDHGCRLWWIEYGGTKDTIHDSEEIKWELWKIVYGVWDYIKNSGAFENVDDLTLEWVGTIPGKRESRRFEGEYILKQQDIVEQKTFADAVAFGGWALDLHPAEGVYSQLPGCDQWHSKGVYQIPYRCFLPRHISNLFLAGRIISATHVAFASTRVMATCAHGGQAVGMAAAMAIKEKCQPKDLQQARYMSRLQQKLNLAGQSIPLVPIQKESDLLQGATVSASSTLELKAIPFDGEWKKLTMSSAQMLPLEQGKSYTFKVKVLAEKATRLTCELRTSSKKQNHTPDTIVEVIHSDLQAGEQWLELTFGEALPTSQYGFLTFLKNTEVSLYTSMQRITGVLTVFNKKHASVSNNGSQISLNDIGVDDFEFWTPERRPDGHNIAMQIKPPLFAFEADNVANGYTRPTHRVNAWVASPDDTNPNLTIRWSEPKPVKSIQLHFDTDFDHPLESSLWGHPEAEIPFCIKNYTIKSLEGEVLHQVQDNRHTLNRVELPNPVSTTGIIIETGHPCEGVPASIFEVCINNET